MDNRYRHIKINGNGLRPFVCENVFFLGRLGRAALFRGHYLTVNFRHEIVWTFYAYLQEPDTYSSLNMILSCSIRKKLMISSYLRKTKKMVLLYELKCDRDNDRKHGVIIAKFCTQEVFCRRISGEFVIGRIERSKLAAIFSF